LRAGFANFGANKLKKTTILFLLKKAVLLLHKNTNEEGLSEYKIMAGFVFEFRISNSSN
jgi:hypothetical protein